MTDGLREKNLKRLWCDELDRAGVECGLARGCFCRGLTVV